MLRIETEKHLVFVHHGITGNRPGVTITIQDRIDSGVDELLSGQGLTAEIESADAKSLLAYLTGEQTR